MGSNYYILIGIDRLVGWYRSKTYPFEFFSQVLLPLSG
jgi:hypothetical protein